MSRKFTFLIMALFALISGPGWGQSFVKVTSTSDLTDGQYLIVYETGGVALNGQLTSDVAANTVAVTISNNQIASTSAIDAAAFTFSAANGSFLGGGGKYIGHTGTSNTLNYSDNPLSNTVSIDNNGNAVIDAGNSYVLRFNKTSGQERFRFYKGSQEFIQLYKKQSTPSTDPTITCANITDVPYQGLTNATATVTFTNADGWTPSVTCDGTIVTTASLSENTVTYSVSENTSNADRPGSFTITLSKEGENNITKVVSVTQNHFVVDYATLPFSHDGGKDNLPDGLTQNGLGSDYNSSPKMKFDDTGDYLILKINENPGTLTFKIKGNSLSGNYVFKLQVSTDGTNFTDKKSYTSISSTTTTETIADLDASVRYIKWIYTTKANGNVALGDINLTKEGVKIPTFSIEEGNYWASQSVALSQADSKPIYYTTNDNDPTTNGTLYLEAISVTSTCTIKAAAQDGTEWSDVVSATYKIAQTYTTVASVNALTEDNIPVIVSMDNWTIESINGNSMYVNDGANSLQIYDNDIPETYAVGGKLSGPLKAVWTTAYDGEVKTVQNWSEINYSAPTFAIVIDDEIENGTIEATPTTATAGTEISFSVTPDDGYRMTAESLIVMDATGEEVEISGNNPYTFIMPASDVTISAEFELIPTTTYQYLYSVNGISGDELEAYEGESITLATSENLNDDFTFAGWTTDESNVENILAAGSSYTVNGNVNFYAVYSKTTEAPVPSAYTAGDEGTFVIATSVEGTYYAIPQNPTVESGKIVGVSIQTSTENNVTYVTAANAEGYSWTIADATYGQTLSDGSNYLYHSNGGVSGTNLTYGNLTTNTWNIISEDNGLSFIGMNNETSDNSRGLLYQIGNVNKFGGYALSNEDNVDYSRIVVLPIKSDMVSLFTRVYNADTELASLTVAGPSIILNGVTLNVTIDMHNTNAANLVIEDGAQLIHNSENGVMATFEKNVHTYSSVEATDGWNLIASPFAGNLSIASHTVFGDNFDLFLYNEPNHYWYNSKIPESGDDHSFDILHNGRGYLYSQAETDGSVIKMDGVLQPSTSDVNILLEYTTMLSGNVPNTLKGFNLVGNPYACNAYLSLYAQLEDHSSAFEQVTFLTLNDEGSGFLITTSSFIFVKAGEGVFVSIPDDYKSLGFEYFAHFSKNLPQNAAPSQALDIAVSKAERGASVINNAIVCFGEGSNTEKFMLNPDNTKIYVPQNGKEYGTVFTQTEGELPVNFKAEKNGSYTITVNTENVEAEYLHLIDNLTGMDTDLLSTPCYTFDAKTSDYASRFKLVFGVKNDNEEMSQASSFAYINNGEIVISNEGRATLQVIDVLGRIVSSETINGECRISTNGLTAGLYILNLNGNVQKIVVR